LNRNVLSSVIDDGWWIMKIQDFSYKDKSNKINTVTRLPSVTRMPSCLGGCGG